MQTSLLDNLGLSHKEIQIYETLLKHGEMLAGQVIKLLSLKRATVYKALYSLEDKGLVIQRKISGKTSFAPEPPQKLLKNFQEKIQKDQQIFDNLKNILPELNSSYIFSLEKPVVTLHGGLEEVQEVFEDILADKGNLREYYTFENVDPNFLTWIVGYFNPKFYKDNREAKLIILDSKWINEYVHLDKISHDQELAFMPKEKMALTHFVIIYGDKVIFGNLDVNENILCIKVHHPLIARTMEHWFDLLWETSKEKYPAPEGLFGSVYKK